MPPDTEDTDTPNTPDALTRAEVDALVREAVRAARATASSEILSQLGVSSIDEVKTTVAAAKAKSEAEKTELERLTQRIAEQEAKATKAESEAKQARHEQVVERLLLAAGVRVEGQDKAAAIAALTRLVPVEVGAEASDISSAIDGLKIQYPGLFGGATSSTIVDESGGKRAVTSTSQSAKERAAQRIAAMQNGSPRIPGTRDLVSRSSSTTNDTKES